MRFYNIHDCNIVMLIDIIMRIMLILRLYYSGPVGRLTNRDETQENMP